jgi:hypothetical protein
MVPPTIPLLPSVADMPVTLTSQINRPAAGRAAGRPSTLTRNGLHRGRDRPRALASATTSPRSFRHQAAGLVSPSASAGAGTTSPVASASR